MVLCSDQQESSPQKVLISSLLSTQELNRITRHKCHCKFELGKRETHLVWKLMHNHCCFGFFLSLTKDREVVEHSWETIGGGLGGKELKLGWSNVCPTPQLSHLHIRQLTFKLLASTWTPWLSKVTSDNRRLLSSGENDLFLYSYI